MYYNFNVMNIDIFKVFCINAIFIIGIFGRLLSCVSIKGVDNTLKLDIYGKYWNRSDLDIYGKYWNRSDADARRYVHGIRNPSHYYLA